MLIILYFLSPIFANRRRGEVSLRTSLQLLTVCRLRTAVHAKRNAAHDNRVIALNHRPTGWDDEIGTECTDYRWNYWQIILLSVTSNQNDMCAETIEELFMNFLFMPPEVLKQNCFSSASVYIGQKTVVWILTQ